MDDIKFYVVLQIRKHCPPIFFGMADGPVIPPIKIEKEQTLVYIEIIPEHYEIVRRSMLGSTT